MQPEQQQRIMGYFIEEAKDHLNTIEQGLLNLQVTIQDTEMVNEVFRAAHSVKGGAAMLGIDSVQRTAHRLEDYFKLLKEAPVQTDRPLESMLLQVFDGLQELLEQLQGPFGLTDDKAQEIMATLEPTFERLNQHLERAVAVSPLPEAVTPASVTSAEQSPGGPGTAAPASGEESALQLVFQSDVPDYLRDMLRLFKQSETPETRAALQDVAYQLYSIGEQFELPAWSRLLETARGAIANEQHSYRSLAPVLIKEIKRAQEQVLGGHGDAIEISPDLLDLLPPEPAEPSEPEPSETLPIAVDFEPTDWAEPTAPNQPEVEPADWADLLDATDTPTHAAAPLAKEGPNIGAAELNSLADLFEGDVGDFDVDWEEEELSEEVPQLSEDRLDADISEDIADFLLADDTSTDNDDELTSLFGDTPWQSEAEPAIEVDDVEPQAPEAPDTLEPTASETAPPSTDEADELDAFFSDIPAPASAAQSEDDSLEAWLEEGVTPEPEAAATAPEPASDADHLDVLSDPWEDAAEAASRASRQGATRQPDQAREADLESLLMDFPDLSESDSESDSELDSEPDTAPEQSTDATNIDELAAAASTEPRAADSGRGEARDHREQDDDWLSLAFDADDTVPGEEPEGATASEAIDSWLPLDTEPTATEIDLEGVFEESAGAAASSTTESEQGHEQLEDDFTADWEEFPALAEEEATAAPGEPDDDNDALWGDDLLGEFAADLEQDPTAAAGSDDTSADETDDLFGDFALDLEQLDLEQDVSATEADALEADTDETDEADALFDDFATDLQTEPALEAAATREANAADRTAPDEVEAAPEDDAAAAMVPDQVSDAIATPEDSEADFDDLDALLAEESDAVSSSPATAPAAPTDDFADLDTLLDAPSSPPEESQPSPQPPAAAAAADDEFEDLEKLLEEADHLGGSAPTVGVHRAAISSRRPSRRPSLMAEQTMRVSVKHLDNLSNLVGELVVNRNSLEQDQERLRQFLDNLLFQVQQLNDVGQRLRDLYERSLLESSLISNRQAIQSRSRAAYQGDNGGANHATGATFDALEMDRFTGFHTLSQEMIELIVRVRESASDIDYTIQSTDQVTRQFRQVTSQLQEGLNKARMVPFAQTADRLPRAVRDISLKFGKEARLVVEGRDTLIDKMILERLYDPMTHLVNNAITHGIELPEERLAAGKPREGVITIRAFYQGNQTVIYIADDGAGIDPEVVKRKAVERGLISAEEAHSFSKLELYELLFQPGFSTRDQADDYAGRGVGMDVVRTALADVRGTVTIDSEPSKGSSFTIRLPLTLSISKALSCLNNQARIAFPMDGVEDMLDVPRDRIQHNDQGQACILWRDTLLPFQPLSDLLQFNRTLGRGRVYGGHQDDDLISIVVLRSANTHVALQIDQVIGEQEIVIKQIEGPVPKPMGIAGATVLGDGRVMPIADVLELIDLSLGRVRRDASGSIWSQAEDEEGSAPGTAAIPSEPTVLIVDDSITVRELLSMSFNKVGYRVEQARDGQEAWEKLRSGMPCDLVFCDIEMPRMDGLELLSRLQKDEQLQQIPIAMLTSRGADRHRQMAVELGAKGYFTKPYLEEVLLDAAQRMLNGEDIASVST